MPKIKKTISLLCPTRERPDKALGLILSVLETAIYPERVEVLFYIDEDDRTRADYIKKFRSREQDLKRFRRCLFAIGDPVGISKAWNELASRCEGNLLVMAADDQTYNDSGWDTRLDEEVLRYPDDIFCMWFNDGHWQDKLCTFPIVSRKWYETLGYFTSGMFECLYDDLWIMEIAQKVGRLNYIPDILTEHFHWSYGKSEIDKTYERNQVNWGGELKPAVKRDMDMFKRTARYRELDARRIAAVMEGQ